jgi:hypothetical protein
MLFAQAGGGFGGAGQNQEVPPEVMAGIIIAALIVFAIGLVIQIFYLLTLSRCFSLIDPRNRRMEPGLVWLNLVPCLNLIWIFFTTSRLADSLRDEFNDRGLHGDGDFGRTLGIVYPVLALIGAIPYIGALFSIGALVCWIIYWVKIAGYSQQLREAGPGRSDDRDWIDEEKRMGRS